MEIWQFWLSIGIIFALLGVIVAICVKKHKDKHKIMVLQKNLEDLEKSFLHLSEEMEVITNHNLERMEEKCESMCELLTVADKKCIYVDDLLKSLDKGVKLIKERNVSDMAFNNANNLSHGKIDRLENEIMTEIESLARRLGYLNNRVENLENIINDNENNSQTAINDEIIDVKNEIKDLKQSVAEMVTNEISKQLSVLDDGFAEIADTAMKIDMDRKGFADNDISEAEIATDYVKTNDLVGDSNVMQLFPENEKKISDNSQINLKREYLPKGKELVVKDIMERYEQGDSIPQIASAVKMSRGEVNLIIKMNEGISIAEKVG